MTTRKRVTHPSQLPANGADQPSRATCKSLARHCQRAVCPKHSPYLYALHGQHRALAAIPAGGAHKANRTGTLTRLGIGQ